MLISNTIFMRLGKNTFVYLFMLYLLGTKLNKYMCILKAALSLLFYFIIKYSSFRLLNFSDLSNSALKNAISEICFSLTDLTTKILFH